MTKQRAWLKSYEAKYLGFNIKPNFKGRSTAQYYVNEKQREEIKNFRLSNTSETETNGYEPKFVLSAWCSERGEMLNIDSYCKKYNLPRKDITSYKLVSHTGTPFYNIVFKENIEEQKIDFDFEPIVKKYIKPLKIKQQPLISNKDFDVLTYTDIHIGMNTNAEGKAMYWEKWDAEEVLNLAELIIITTLKNRESETLIVDDLGDFFDGFNGQTTRGGHSLPQNMTNEEVFDTGLKFKMKIAERLIPFYSKIVFNNICNDNHSGAFSYFVNSAFKQLIEQKYKGVTVTNHKQFINHYFVGKVCFVITHGKDDKHLKFGFKPFQDSKSLEKIDQYLKQNNIYKQADLIVFKKGDSHQALFDLCTSDDFFYFNYPAGSPSSEWVQTNFKKGRRGFVNESYFGKDFFIKPFFIQK